MVFPVSNSRNGQFHSVAFTVKQAKRNQQRTAEGRKLNVSPHFIQECKRQFLLLKIRGKKYIFQNIGQKYDYGR